MTADASPAPSEPPHPITPRTRASAPIRNDPLCASIRHPRQRRVDSRRREGLHALVRRASARRKHSCASGAWHAGRRFERAVAPDAASTRAAAGGSRYEDLREEKTSSAPSEPLAIGPPTMRERARDLTALHAHVQKQSPGRVLRPRHPPAAHRGRGPGDARARRGDHPRNEHHPRRRRHHRPRGDRARLPDVAEAGAAPGPRPTARSTRPPACAPAARSMRSPRPASSLARAMGAGSAAAGLRSASIADRLQGRPLRRPHVPARDGRPAPAAAARSPSRAGRSRSTPAGSWTGGDVECDVVVIGHRRGRRGGGPRARRARTRGGLRRGRAALPPPQLRREHGARLRALLPAGRSPWGTRPSRC